MNWILQMKANVVISWFKLTVRAVLFNTTAEGGMIVTYW
jgi:hypothetical protein